MNTTSAGYSRAKGLRSALSPRGIGLALLTLFIVSAVSEVQASEYANPLFAYTHLLPSPLTLPQGRLVLGTDVAYGAFDSVQIGTGLLRDFYQVYNANIRANFVDYPEFALGASVSYENYNYKDLYSGNPDLRVSAWRPGLVGAYEILPRLAGFVGGSLNISHQTLNSSQVQTSGYIQGAEAEYDLAWAYNPPKKQGIGNVLSGGVSYDFTYKIAGLGISHSWRGFRLGIHYYPNAGQNRILPLIGGGAVVDF